MSNKVPKEIFINNPSNPNFKGGDFKYLSEEYFKEELAKKEKEIERLKNIAIAYIRNNKKNQ